MIKTCFKISIISLFFFIVFSCEKPTASDEIVITKNVIPGQDNEELSEEIISSGDAVVFQEFSPQILIDRDYSIYEIQNINIDLDESDEQIIIAAPLNDGKAVFQIYVADYNPKKDEYIEIYKDDISFNNLNLVSLLSEDFTGDHIPEVIVTGIDNKDLQVYEIYKMIEDKESEQMNFRKVFSQAVDGVFELNKAERGNDYKIDLLKGDSYSLEVQKKNPDAEDNLIIEKYKWNDSVAYYELSSSEKMNISSSSNQELVKFYRGSSEDYLKFLSGPWFKIKDLNGNPTHNMNEIFMIQIPSQTMTFYANDIQESFTWADDKHPIKYRNVLSFYDVRNNYLTSMYYSISIYIDSFESIQVRIRGNQRWGGTYTQLTDNLQNVLTDKSKENSLISEMEIKGLYKTNLNTELIFDSPEYTLKEGGVESRGIYTIFTLNDGPVLEMKELNSNGLTVQIKSYKMDYNEISDDLRVIRTITLQRGILNSTGIDLESNSELHFEQIEKINQDVTDN